MSLDGIFGIHEQALQLRAQRTEVLASNLANADTPGFQARDYDFKEVLSDIANKNSSVTIEATNPRHITSADELVDPILKYRIPLQTKLDGNTVDTQVENAKFAENSMKYIASLRFVDSKIKNMLTAIRGE